jgi:hypothetical protein
MVCVYPIWWNFHADLGKDRPLVPVRVVRTAKIGGSFVLFDCNANFDFFTFMR